MAFTPAPGVCEVYCQYGAPGGPQYNIYHVLLTTGGPWDVATMTTLLNLFKSWETTTAHAYRNPAVGLQGVRGRDLSTQFGTEVSITASQPGTFTGDPMPDNVTIAIKMVTGVAGRSHRGRTYWIGLARPMIVNDTLQSPYDTDIVGALQSLYSSVNGGGPFELGVLSAQENKTPLNPRKFHPMVGWALVDNNLDSQRRRLAGHNIHR